MNIIVVGDIMPKQVSSGSKVDYKSSQLANFFQAASQIITSFKLSSSKSPLPRDAQRLVDIGELLQLLHTDILPDFKPPSTLLSIGFSCPRALVKLALSANKIQQSLAVPLLQSLKEEPTTQYTNSLPSSRYILTHTRLYYYDHALKQLNAIACSVPQLTELLKKYKHNADPYALLFADFKNIKAMQGEPIGSDLMTVFSETIKPFIDSPLSFKFAFLVAIKFAQLFDGQRQLSLIQFAPFFPFGLFGSMNGVQYAVDTRVLTMHNADITYTGPIDNLAYFVFQSLVRCLKDCFLLHQEDYSLREFIAEESGKLSEKPVTVLEFFSEFMVGTGSGAVAAAADTDTDTSVTDASVIIPVPDEVTSAAIPVVAISPSPDPIVIATDLDVPAPIAIVDSSSEPDQAQALQARILELCGTQLPGFGAEQARHAQVYEKLESYRQQILDYRDSVGGLSGATLNELLGRRAVLEQQSTQLLDIKFPQAISTWQQQLRRLQVRLQTDLNEAQRIKQEELSFLQVEQQRRTEVLQSYHAAKVASISIRQGLTVAEAQLANMVAGERQLQLEFSTALREKDAESHQAEAASTWVDHDKCVGFLRRGLGSLAGSVDYCQRIIATDEDRLGRLNKLYAKVHAKSSKGKTFILEKNYHEFLGDDYQLLVKDPAVIKCMDKGVVKATTTWHIDDKFDRSLAHDISSLQNNIAEKKRIAAEHGSLHALFTDYLDKMQSSRQAIESMESQVNTMRDLIVVGADSDVESLRLELARDEQSLTQGYAEASRLIAASYQQKLQDITAELESASSAMFAQFNLAPLRSDVQALEELDRSLVHDIQTAIATRSKRAALLCPLLEQLKQCLGYRMFVSQSGLLQTDIMNGLHNYIIDGKNFNTISQLLIENIGQHRRERGLTSKLSAIIAAMIDCEHLSQEATDAMDADVRAAVASAPSNLESCIDILSELPGSYKVTLQTQLRAIIHNFQERKYAENTTAPVTQKEYREFTLHFMATLRSYAVHFGEERQIWQRVVSGFLTALSKLAQLLGVSSTVDPLSIRTRHPFLCGASWYTMTKAEDLAARAETVIEAAADEIVPVAAAVA